MYRCIIAVFLLVAAGPLYSGRISKSLDGLWDNGKLNEKQKAPTGWKKVRVPDLRMERRISYAECYKRKFQLDSILSGYRYLLRFEQVNFICDIYINNRKVTTHLGGYIPFEADITDYVKAGENRIDITTFNVQSVEMKGLRTNGSLPPELRSDMTLAAEIADHERCVPVSPQGNQMRNWGITGHVTLDIVPDVYINDIFVKPSVIEKKLEIEAEVKNSSSMIYTGKISGKIPLSSNSSIELPEQLIQVLPGKSKVITWKNISAAGLKLWWPKMFRPESVGKEAPKLYCADLSLVSNDSSTHDVLNQRFGYRQLWIDKERFVLNGIPIRFMGTTAHFGEGGMDPRKFYDKVEAAGCNIVRLHYHPRNHDWYDLADERGIPVVGETAIGLVNGTHSNNPVFWKNCHKHVEAFIKARRNNPSILMWSIENEMGLDGYGKVTDDEVRKLYRHAMKFDSTRPMEAEGDSDMDIMPVINVHCWWDYDKSMYPEKFFWKEKNRCFKRYRTFKDVPYYGKPLYVGEFSTEWCDGPEDYRGEPAIIKGNAAYTVIRNDRFKLRGEITAKQIESFRYQNIAGMAPFTIFETRTQIPGPYSDKLKQAFRPVVVILREVDGNFFGGRPLARTLKVINDSADKQLLRLRWSLKSRTGHLDCLPSKGEENFALAPGECRIIKISSRIPSVNSVAEITFQVELSSSAGNIIDRLTNEYRVFPTAKKTIVSSGINLYCYQTDDSSLRKVKEFFPDAVHISSLNRSFPEGKSIIMIMPDKAKGMNQNEKHKLQEFVRNGGVVIVLDQSVSLVPGLLMGPPKSYSINFVNLPKHPIMTSPFLLDDNDMRYWKNHALSKQMFRKPAGAGFRLLTSGGFDMDCTSLVEYRDGKGMWLCSQLALMSQFNDDPVAASLLRRLLSYSVDFLAGKILKTSGKKAVVLGDVFPQIFIQQRDIVKLATLKSIAFNDVDILFLSGKELIEQNDEAIRKIIKFVESGGTLYIYGLNPAEAKKLNGLLPAAKTVKFTGNQVTVNGDPELFRGLTAADFYWCSDYHRVKKTTRPIGQFSSSFFSAKELTSPALYSIISKGNGRIIVDQLLWASTSNDKARRIGNTIFDNLGVGSRSIQAAGRSVKYTTLSLDSYVNRTFFDKKANDGDNGWTDQGENDLRVFRPGKQSFDDIPFQICERDGGMGIVLSGNTSLHYKLPEKTPEIPVNKKLDLIYFLQGAAWAHGNCGWKYIIHYQDGSSVDIPVLNNVNVADWWAEPRRLSGAGLAWSGNNAEHMISLYVQVWRNPFPKREVAAVSVLNDQKIVAFVIAVTVAEYLN